MYEPSATPDRGAVVHGPGTTERVEAFFSESRDQLVALDYLMTGDRETAQDVVHDVVVGMLGRDLDSVADLAAYARRAVVNGTHSHGRRRARANARAQRLGHEEHRLTRTQGDPFGAVEVMESLHTLTTRQRTVVALRYYLDMTEASIAATIGCAPATVRSIHRRAIQRLRTELTREANDHG